MKFKVINERTKEVVGSGLAICAAREVAKKYNNIEKVDYFYIKEQNKNNIKVNKILEEYNKDEEIYLNCFRHVEHLIKKYPNDADLGGIIRKQYKR